MFRFEQGESLTRIFTRYLTMVGIPFKVIPIFIQLNGSKNGKRLIHQLWKKMHAFFPPLPSSLAQENSLEVLQIRIIAIIWLEILCAIIIASLTIYAQVHLSWSPIFTTTTLFTPLVNILYCKVISGIIYVIGLVQNTDLFAVLSECGCFKSMHYQYHQDDSSNNDGAYEEGRLTKVLIDRPFLKFNGFLKIVDTIVSIIAWVSLFQSKQLGGLDQPKEVRLVLGFVILSLVLSSMYGFFLASVVVW